MMLDHPHFTGMSHNAYDNAGPSIPGLGKDLEPTSETVADCAAEDLAAFDQLGPLTRASMNEGVVRWSSVKTLELIRHVWRSDPKNQFVDRKMADMIRQASIDVALKIRVHDERMLKLMDEGMKQ
jgi:hypothetical protein